jgi:isopenicillin-N N-acyltransferase-like protein
VSAGDRGRGFGRAHADAVTATVTVYRRLLRETAGDLAPHGDRVAAALHDRWPELIEEVEGIAAGAGQDPLELLAINARTELLAPGPAAECSVIGRVGDGGVELAQTWDWHPDLAPARVVVTTAAPGRPWFTTVTEAGILAKLGLNELGLACGLNFLTCSADGGLEGVPIHVLLRILLERCGSAADALGLLLGERVSASSCVTVAVSEPGGAALFAVELSPGGAAVVWPDADGCLVHTNHCLSPPARGEDTQPRVYPSTLLRRWHLQRRLRAGTGSKLALAEHFPAGEPVCRHADEGVTWAERYETLLAIAMDPGAPALEVAAGPPCCTPFRTVTLP